MTKRTTGAQGATTAASIDPIGDAHILADTLFYAMQDNADPRHVKREIVEVISRYCQDRSTLGHLRPLLYVLGRMLDGEQFRLHPTPTASATPGMSADDSHSMTARAKPKAVVAVSSAQTFIAACNDAFGVHPEDVIATINSTAETLCQLHEIFKTISNDALDDRKAYRIKALADAGAYLAFDIGNIAGCEQEKMLEKLKAAGIVRSEQEGAA